MDTPDYDAVAMLHGCTHKMRQGHWNAMNFWYGCPTNRWFKATCYTSDREGFVCIEDENSIPRYNGDGYEISPLT